MDHSTDEVLEYILFLARRVPSGDISTATLILLMELGVPNNLDGFESVREAIVLKVERPRLQMSEIYLELSNDSDIDVFSEERAIRSCITAAWNNRIENKWEYFFPENLRKKKRPANKEFISHIARIIELWSKCQKEVVYGKE